jgi:cellobiose-specific phosphotransferase system component IIC
MSKGAASSLTVASPAASRATMARRVGSASAAKALFRVSEGVMFLSGYIANWLY